MVARTYEPGRNCRSSIAVEAKNESSEPPAQLLIDDADGSLSMYVMQSPQRYSLAEPNLLAGTPIRPRFRLNHNPCDRCDRLGTTV